MIVLTKGGIEALHRALRRVYHENDFGYSQFKHQFENGAHVEDLLRQSLDHRNNVEIALEELDVVITNIVLGRYA